MFPRSTALILVDIQNDFCPGGSLAVPSGDQIVDVVNGLAPAFQFVAATKDWHPSNHISFKENGGVWPPHCVQGTRGADLHPDLKQSNIELIARKGFSVDKDTFEGLDAISPAGATLDEVLRRAGVESIYVAGLATDYCVKATVLDALKKGYEVFAITDAMRAVDVEPGDGQRALAEMKKGGAQLVTAGEVVNTSQKSTTGSPLS